MRLFFYTAENSATSARFLARLRKFQDLKQIVQLPSGCGLGSPPGLDLRSGDLIIFYAANGRELEKLAALTNAFANFRIIIVLDTYDPSLVRQAYLLGAIFVTDSENGQEEIAMIAAKVMHRLRKKTARRNRNRQSVG
ncbi:MAG: hypothetical protein GXO34_07115 [Deltaproteobacteria bacterium]|nr:hypothetical protein [Deltaproteobacteria bacterium]